MELEGREGRHAGSIPGRADIADSGGAPSPRRCPAPDVHRQRPGRSIARPSAARPATMHIGRAVSPMWPMRMMLPAPWPAESCDAVARTDVVADRDVREAVGHRDGGDAGGGDARRGGHSRRPMASHTCPAWPSRHARGAPRRHRRPSSSSASAAASTPLRSDTDGVNGNGPCRATVPPVEQRQERAAWRVGIGVDGRPRLRADGHQRHAWRAAEALLGARHEQVELPRLRLQLDAAERADTQSTIVTAPRAGARWVRSPGPG